MVFMKFRRVHSIKSNHFSSYLWNEIDSFQISNVCHLSQHLQSIDLLLVLRFLMKPRGFSGSNKRTSDFHTNFGWMKCRSNLFFLSCAESVIKLQQRFIQRHKVSSWKAFHTRMHDRNEKWEREIRKYFLLKKEEKKKKKHRNI